MGSVSELRRAQAREARLTVDRPTMAVALALFLMAASFSLAKTGRDALFFLEDGIYDLPLAYTGVAVLSLPVAAGTLSVMRRTGSRRARVVLLLGAAAGLLSYAALARPGGGPLMTTFFMAVPLVYNVLFALVWLLGADLMGRRTEPAQTRFYAQIGAASLAGSFAGALGARTLTPAVDAPQLLALGGAVLAGAALVVAAAQRLCPPAPAAVPAAPMVRQTAQSLLRIPYFRHLLAIAVAAALVGILVEFQFYLAAAAEGRSADDNVVLFANLYLGLAALAVLVQLFVTPALHARIGVSRTLLVLPAVIAALAPATIVSPSLGLRSGLRLAEGGLKSSVHRVSWERAFLAFQPRQRGAAKLLIDGSASRIAEGVAAVSLYVWLSSRATSGLARGDPGWVGFLLLAVAATWIVLTKLMESRVEAACRMPAPPAAIEGLAPPRGPDCCPIVTTLGAPVQAAEAPYAAVKPIR